MNNFLKIVKINLLALIALPLLILSTAAKLFARMLGKFVKLFGIAALAVGIILIFETARDLDAATDMFLLIAIALGLFLIFVIAFIVAMFIVSLIVKTFAKILTISLEAFYQFIYDTIYIKLYQLCTTEYESLPDTISPVARKVSCFLYMILFAIHNALLFFLRHAMTIMSIVAIGVVVGGVGVLNMISNRDYGIGIFEFISLFPTFEIVYGVVLYLAVTLGIASILFIIGAEWSQWGAEMQGVISVGEETQEETSNESINTPVKLEPVKKETA